jgi:hypothetical protein
VELLRSIPFRYRVAAGVGFFAVGLAGWMGSLKEAGAAASASWHATGAAWNGRDALAASFTDARTDHQIGSLVDVGTGSLSLVASALLLQGAWRRIMRVDGQWAFEAPVAGAQPITPEVVPAAIDGEPTDGRPALELVASTDDGVPVEAVGNVYYVDFGGKEEVG